jgi:hypothetical protein
MFPSIILEIRKHQTSGRNQVEIQAEVWSKNLDSGTRIMQKILGRAKFKGFQTLSKKLLICVPKNSKPKFEPSIRIKPAQN